MDEIHTIEDSKLSARAAESLLQKKLRSYHAKLTDQKWRLNNLYKIIDKYGQVVQFKLNNVQRDLLKNMWYLNIVLKARQFGVSTFYSLLALDYALFSSNTVAGIIAHNLDDAQKIFRDKIKFAYDNLPIEIRNARNFSISRANEIMFSNNSRIRVSTSFRSGTVQFLHISEFGKICADNPIAAQEIVTGALNAVQAGQFVNIESTAAGRSGYFYDMAMRAIADKEKNRKLTKLDYRLHFYPWWMSKDYVLDGDVVVTNEFMEYFKSLLYNHGVRISPAQRRWYVKKYELLGDKMYQEFPSFAKEAFNVSLKGSYYNIQMSDVRKKRRITSVPYDRSLPVFTAWDLGLNDLTEIIFCQKHGFEVRIIDHYWNCGPGLDHYAKVLHEKGYHYATHFLPHDIQVRSLAAEGQRRLDILYDLMPGHELMALPRFEIADGIECVKSLLYYCWFDEKKCERLLSALDEYRKVWNDKMGTYMNKPLHNWASDAADAFRYLALGLREVELQETEGYGGYRSSGYEGDYYEDSGSVSSYTGY